MNVFKKYNKKEDFIELINPFPSLIYNHRNDVEANAIARQRNSMKCLKLESNRID